MKKQKGFTLVEILVSIVISSFIMMVLLQSLRHTFRFLSDSKKLIFVDKEVSLLFNQLERDLSSAFIPKLEALRQAQGERGELGVASKPEEKKPPKPIEKKEQKTDYFVATIKEDEVGGFVAGLKKGQKLLDSVSFISTNPLKVYGVANVRLVRVGYELVLNKEKSEEEKPCYDLLRKESEDLENIQLKPSEEIARKKEKKLVSSYIVAQNIKEFYIEYVRILESKKKPGETTKEEREIEQFVWGDDEKTKDILPHSINISLVLWNEKKTREYNFESFVPILSIQDKIEKKKAAPKAAPKKPDEKNKTPTKTQGGLQKNNTKRTNS